MQEQKEVRLQPLGEALETSCSAEKGLHSLGAEALFLRAPWRRGWKPRPFKAGSWIMQV